ncbi:MAG: hypothetical protein ACLUHA_13300 [Bacteroides stercoris]
MNEQAIQEQYQHIVNLLEQKRLKEAQVQLEAFLWNCNDWTLRNRLEQAKVSYQCACYGSHAPGRKRSGTAEVYTRQLLAETWELARTDPLSAMLSMGFTRHYQFPCTRYKRTQCAVHSAMSSWLK